MTRVYLYLSDQACLVAYWIPVIVIHPSVFAKKSQREFLTNDSHSQIQDFASWVAISKHRENANQLILTPWSVCWCQWWCWWQVSLSIISSVIALGCQSCKEIQKSLLQNQNQFLFFNTSCVMHCGRIKPQNKYISKSLQFSQGVF